MHKKKPDIKPDVCQGHILTSTEVLFSQPNNLYNCRQWHLKNSRHRRRWELVLLPYGQLCCEATPASCEDECLAYDQFLHNCATFWNGRGILSRTHKKVHMSPSLIPLKWFLFVLESSKALKYPRILHSSVCCLLVYTLYSICSALLAAVCCFSPSEALDA